jgi:hypothetical protein
LKKRKSSNMPALEVCQVVKSFVRPSCSLPLWIELSFPEMHMPNTASAAVDVNDVAASILRQRIRQPIKVL